MCALLWSDTPAGEHRREIALLLTSGHYGTLPATIFVAHDQTSKLAGFLQAGLRSHADGCDTAYPVGFIEGWFVYEPLRRQGIGGALMRAAEQWACAQGCIEMASDTWIDHALSQTAHQSLGFEIIDRCVHFRKRLQRDLTSPYPISNSGSTGICIAVASALVSAAMPTTARNSAYCWSVRPLARAAAVWECTQ
jgi:aminoglycoside 6'-N-acetyltransferase I